MTNLKIAAITAAAIALSGLGGYLLGKPNKIEAIHVCQQIKQQAEESKKIADAEVEQINQLFQVER